MQSTYIITLWVTRHGVGDGGWGMNAGMTRMGWRGFFHLDAITCYCLGVQCFGKHA